MLRGCAIVAAASMLAVVALFAVGLLQLPGWLTDPAPDWRTDPSEPYPFTAPVPPLIATNVDGRYDRPRTQLYEGELARCTRCPPYPLDRARSQLTLDRGRFLLEQFDPPYRTRGHFVVEGERITLQNDPECGDVRGILQWSVDAADRLTFAVVDDPCAFDQRAHNLTLVPWQRLPDG